jgi:hypothetical protein
MPLIGTDVAHAHLYFTALHVLGRVTCQLSPSVTHQITGVPTCQECRRFYEVSFRIRQLGIISAVEARGVELDIAPDI